MLLFHSTDSGVVTPRRRSLEDKETSSESTYSDVGNSNEDLFVCTEDDGPMDFSTSTQDKMSVDRADEAAGVPRTSSSGAKGNITNPNIRYRSCRNSQISHSKTEEDSTDPKSRSGVNDSKSKVNI